MIGRDRNTRTGGLRYRVTIQQPNPTYGTNLGQPIPSWTAWLTNEPADVDFPSGGQGSRGRQVEETVSAVFSVRYRSGHSVENRVVYDGQNYGIVRIKQVGGRQRWLELHCKSVET